jgi:hypothetical protein
VSRRAALLAGLALGTAAGAGGCVERELVIDSNPQGALVYLNGQEIGRTPLRKEFTWYGTYDVVVRKEGFETLKTQTPIIAPAWQWVPVDLAAELVPVPLKDTHRVSYTLKPVTEQQVDPDRLVQRGTNFRQRLESGVKAAQTQPTTGPVGQ